MLLKIFGVLMTMVILLGSTSVPTCRHTSSSDTEELAATVKAFFTVWLLERNVPGALKYVSAHPILGNCATPEFLDRKGNLSQKDIVNVFQQAFSSALTNLPKQKQITDVIESAGYIPSNDLHTLVVDHSMKSLFELFSLKVNKGEDVRYICKFDERKAFRERVSRPDIYYVVTKIKGDNPQNYAVLEFLWIKEGNAWRILTLAEAEN